MTYVSSGPASDIAPGTMKGVDVGGRKVLLANVEGTLYAIQRKCPHMGFDLCKGRLEGAKVTCKMHDASFDLRTGEAIGKAKILFFKTMPKPAATYPVKVERGEVMVDI